MNLDILFMHYMTKGLENLAILTLPMTLTEERLNIEKLEDYLHLDEWKY